MKDQIDDSEVVQMMMDGGEKLCDYAIAQWNSGKYNLPDQTPIYVKKYSLIKMRMAELGRLLKQELKNAE